MTSEEIRAAITANHMALVPDTNALAEALSVGRTRAIMREVGNGLILATIGFVSGNALLDVLTTQADYRHVKPLVEQGRLDVSSPLVAATLQSMVGTVLTQPEVDALLALGTEPDPISEYQVRAAIYADNGELLV